MPKSKDARMAERLREAHVAFELDRWQGEAGRERLHAMLARFWRWAEATPLEHAVSVPDIRAAVVRLGVELEPPADLASVVGVLADALVRAGVNRRTRVRDVIDRDLFDEGVSMTVELESLRARLFERLLNSPVYAALASDILYQGIKDYIFSDSSLIGAVPGVSRLLKGSSAAVGRHMPGLEARVEARVKAYIEHNTMRTLARTQARLLDSLDADRIRTIADEVWAATADQRLSAAEDIDTDDLQRLVDYGTEVWRAVRDAPYTARLLEEAVETYFDAYGSETVADVIGQFGLDHDALSAEADALGPALLEGLADTGLLEDLIRDRLAEFYDSDAFVDALHGES